MLSPASREKAPTTPWFFPDWSQFGPLATFGHTNAEHTPRVLEGPCVARVLEECHSGAAGGTPGDLGDRPANSGSDDGSRSGDKSDCGWIIEDATLLK